MALQTVNRSSPCRICGKPDQCSQSEDGLVCCYRSDGLQEGYRVVKKDTATDGRSYTIYSPLEAYHPKALPIKTNPFNAAVYAAILERLKLLPEEQHELSRRGITDFTNYGSMPFNNAAVRSQIACELLETHGPDVFKVAGISKNNPSGKGTKPWLEGPEGLMIPVGDVEDWQVNSGNMALQNAKILVLPQKPQVVRCLFAFRSNHEQCHKFNRPERSCAHKFLQARQMVI